MTASIDVDAVELNGMKLTADNNLVINYFMESMIDFGYITLFSAAFPIGPLISLLMNLLEIRMKIITYLYVYKKPSAERAPGIGDWLDIWEYMSFFGVVIKNFFFYESFSSSQILHYSISNNQICSEFIIFPIVSSLPARLSFGFTLLSY